MHQDATWYGGRPQPMELCVRRGPSPLIPKRGRSPLHHFRHVCCGQTAAWIKTPLGMEVGLCSGDIVLDGDSALPPQTGGGAPSPIIGPCLLWPKGCMDQDATWYESRPQPMRHCVRWGCSSLSPKGAQLLNFRPMKVVAKRQEGLTCHLVWR